MFQMIIHPCQVTRWTVDITGVDFTGANLKGANFFWTNLEEADFTGAIADRDTVWPGGFDPKAAGVIFED